LQTVPDVSLVVVSHVTYPPVWPRGQWNGPICNREWTFDYCGWPGMLCSVGKHETVAPPGPREPGTWHLYGPNVPYRECFNQPEMLFEDMWMRFRLRGPWVPFSDRAFTAIHDAEGRLAGYVRTMYAVWRLGAPGGELILHGLLLAVLGELATAARAGGQGTQQNPWEVVGASQAAATEGRLLHRVDATVCKRLALPPSLAELADIFSISVSSLAHRFKAETGMTVIERIRWLRIREARRLLLKPNASIKSVAYQLGFSSPAYFSKVFSTVAGISPGSHLKAAGVV